MRIRSAIPRSRQHGSAVIVVLVLLSILIMYALGNARTLAALKQQLRVIEMRQANSWPRRLTPTPAPPAAASTNAVSSIHE